MSEPPQRTGSCLCGAVKLRAVGHPLETHICHCISCQKSTGVAFSQSTIFKVDDVGYESADGSTLRTHKDSSADSGAVVEKSFCGICGSPVRVQSDKFPGLLGVPAGVIDGEKEDLKPAMELYCDRRSAWLGDTGVGPAARFAKLPTEDVFKGTQSP
ncbi:hypothetical protein F5Y15DRAFT_392771 [Xylariaceae sp. FL0016]|nr:hypothetical protein F5Y15DRAFT_392771 [Xylariaceae sp. FL0016]